MFIFGHFFASMALLFSMVFKMLYFLLVLRVILSWFAVDPYNELVRVLYAITEPLLAPLRRIPLQVAMVDLSPILAFILLTFLDSFVVGVLRGLAIRFGT